MQLGLGKLVESSGSYEYQFKKSVVLVELKYLPRRDAKCKFTWDVVHVMEGLKQYQNVNVTRNVCINAQKVMSPSKFRSLVFGDQHLHGLRRWILNTAAGHWNNARL